MEEEKCRVKTYQEAVKSLKELQEFAVQRNDSDMLSVISEAKVFVESEESKLCAEALLEFWYNYKK
jgi:hypothetical protein